MARTGVASPDGYSRAAGESGLRIEDFHEIAACLYNERFAILGDVCNMKRREGLSKRRRCVAPFFPSRD